MMKITDSVLFSVKGFLNVDSSGEAFDREIIPHVMASLGKLSQNGVGVPTIIDESTTWENVISQEVINDPEVFSLLPLFIMLTTKILFDPPPPSSVEFHKAQVDELLWRLSMIYESKGVINNG